MTGRTRTGEFLERYPVRFTLAFEGSLALLACVLAVVSGLRPWLEVHASAAALVQSALATAPLVIGMLALMRLDLAWIRELDRFVQEHLLPLFRNAGMLSIGAISLMAGIGEELLFRGVAQAGLSGLVGPVWALAAASLLFGLAHAMTRAYFVLACLIGLYLGWLYQATGNLLVPILVHFLYDWIVLSRYLRRMRREG